MDILLYGVALALMGFVSFAVFYAVFFAPIVADTSFGTNTLLLPRWYDYGTLLLLVATIFGFCGLALWLGMNQIDALAESLFGEWQFVVAFMPCYTVFMVLGLVSNRLGAVRPSVVAVRAVVAGVVSTLAYLALCAAF